MRKNALVFITTYLACNPYAAQLSLGMSGRRSAGPKHKNCFLICGQHALENQGALICPDFFNFAGHSNTTDFQLKQAHFFPVCLLIIPPPRPFAESMQEKLEEEKGKLKELEDDLPNMDTEGKHQGSSARALGRGPQQGHWAGVLSRALSRGPQQGHWVGVLIAPY